MQRLKNGLLCSGTASCRGQKGGSTTGDKCRLPTPGRRWQSLRAGRSQRWPGGGEWGLYAGGQASRAQKILPGHREVPPTLKAEAAHVLGSRCVWGGG